MQTRPMIATMQLGLVNLYMSFNYCLTIDYCIHWDQSRMVTTPKNEDPISNDEDMLNQCSNINIAATSADIVSLFLLNLIYFYFY